MDGDWLQPLKAAPLQNCVAWISEKCWKVGEDSEDESEVRVKQSKDNRSCTEMYGVTGCDT